MQQSLQGAFFTSVKVGLWKRFGNDSGKKMVLVGKTDWSRTRRLGYFGTSSPLDVRGNIGQLNLLRGRGQLCLAHPDPERTLHAMKRVTLRAGNAVLDDQDDAQ